MFDPGPPSRRRELLRIGALSILGGTLADGRVSARAESLPASADGWKRHCIFMLLQGGPSHIDLWDPKPGAVAEIRGPWRPIDTNVPGIRFGEPMERSATVADKLCVIRSMTHRFTNHIAGTYVTLTGSTKQTFPAPAPSSTRSRPPLPACRGACRSPTG